MPLQQDLNLVQMRKEAIPAGGEGGYLKRKADGNLTFAQVPDGAVKEGDFDPNGILFSYAGDLFKQRGASPALWQNQDGLSTWAQLSTSGAKTPTDWIEWGVPGTQTGNAWNSGYVDVDWTASGFGTVAHGTAISLNGSKNAQVTEDGWYVLDCYVDVTADSSGTQWDFAQFRLIVNRTFAIGGDSQDSVLDLVNVGPEKVSNQFSAAATFSWTGYLKNGDTVVVGARLNADADPTDSWSIDDGQFRMEKLPL